MAKKSGTVFQALDKAITGNWNPQDTVTPHINTYDMSNMGNDVIYRTPDKEEYLSKKLELQQNKYLKDKGKCQLICYRICWFEQRKAYVS